MIFWGGITWYFHIANIVQNQNLPFYDVWCVKNQKIVCNNGTKVLPCEFARRSLDSFRDVLQERKQKYSKCHLGVSAQDAETNDFRFMKTQHKFQIIVGSERVSMNHYLTLLLSRSRRPLEKCIARTLHAQGDMRLVSFHRMMIGKPTIKQLYWRLNIAGTTINQFRRSRCFRI